MKKLFIPFLLLFFSTLYSQNDKPVLPELLPVSPTAAEMGLYGNIPTDLSTGRLGSSIPLYDIKVGKHSIPIALRYSHGGLMAEQDPTALGLGWSLNHPGAITRQINGKPDDILGGYLYASSGKNRLEPYFAEFYEGAPPMSTQNLKNLYYDSSQIERFDSEPDRFTINAFDLSGTFSINWDRQVVVVAPYENLEIQLIDGTNYSIASFIVTNEKGVVYEFTEQERNYSTYENGDSNSSQNYTTSWLLTRISFPDTSEDITFNYTPYDYRKDTRSLNSRYEGTNTSPSGSTFVLSTSDMDNKKLTKITFPNGELNLDYKGVQGGTTGVPFVNYIEVKQATTEIIKYKFEYSILSIDANYDKLKTLMAIEKSVNGVIHPFYSMEYYPNLPTSILNEASQDLWGYYNGISLAKLQTDSHRIIDYPNTLKGALKKINYPTGGYTEVEYEPNEIDYTYSFSDADFYCDDIEYNDTVTVLSDAANGSPVTTDIVIQGDQVIKVFLEVLLSANGSEADVSLTSPSGSIQSWNKCSYDFYPSLDLDIDMSTGNEFKSKTGYLQVTDGTTLRLAASTTPGTNHRAKIEIDFYNPSLGILNTPIGGIRVKKTTDCTGTGDCISKDYAYVEEDAMGVSSGVEVGQALYLTAYFNLGFSGCYQNQIYRYRSFSSNVALANYNGSHVLYKRVEITDNGTMLNGKRVQTFIEGEPAVNIAPWAFRDTNSWKRGHLQKEEVFENKNGQLELIETTENEYTQKTPRNAQEAWDDDSISLGFKAMKHVTHYVYGCSQMASTLSDYSNAQPVNYSHFFSLDKTTNTKWLDGQQIVEETQYFYDQFTGLTTKQTAVTYKDVGNTIEEKISTHYSYPQDLLGEPKMQDLTNANRISEPVQVRTSFDDGSTEKTLGRQKTAYETFGGKILPSIVKTALRDNNLENRITYHDYDSYGNPVEVSQEGGAHICYIWSYNGQYPVVKIDNMNYGQIGGSYVANIQDPDPTSDLVTEQDLLRGYLQTNFPNAQMTSYTYIPLVGVHSITDPRGYTITYQYDELNRLEYVKDRDQKVLSKNEYNYKN